MKYRLFGPPEPADSQFIGTAKAQNVMPFLNHAGDLCWRSRPGLVSVLPARQTLRGWKVVGDTLYAVFGRDFVKISTAFQVTTIGQLEINAGYVNMNPVSIENNMFHLVLVDGTEGYAYKFEDQSFAKILGFPGGASLAFMKGFLLSEGPGDNHGFVFSSNVFDATAWDASNYGSAESHPDNISYVAAQGDTLYLFGPTSIEAWYYTGDSGFAFSPLPGAALDYGLVSAQTVVPFRGMITALLQSGGDLMVASMNGYQLAPLSREPGKSSALEAEWKGYASIEDAVATAYSIGGHSIYQITFPSANDGYGKTWAYDGATGVWFNLSSGIDGERFWANQAIAFDGNIIVADWQTNELYRLDMNVFQDDETDVVFELQSDAIKDEGRFHNLLRLWMDFEMGGVPSVEGGWPADDFEPYIRVSLSGDNGISWKPDRLVNLGRRGDIRRRVVQRRWGRFLNGVVRVRGTYPEKFVLAGAGVELG